MCRRPKSNNAMMRLYTNKCLPGKSNAPVKRREHHSTVQYHASHRPLTTSSHVPLAPPPQQRMSAPIDPSSISTWEDAFQHPIPRVRQLERQLRAREWRRLGGSETQRPASWMTKEGLPTLQMLVDRPDLRAQKGAGQSEVSRLVKQN